MEVICYLSGAQRVLSSQFTRWCQMKTGRSGQYKSKLRNFYCLGHRPPFFPQVQIASRLIQNGASDKWTRYIQFYSGRFDPSTTYPAACIDWNTSCVFQGFQCQERRRFTIHRRRSMSRLWPLMADTWWRPWNFPLIRIWEDVCVYPIRNHTPILSSLENRELCFMILSRYHVILTKAHSLNGYGVCVVIRSENAAAQVGDHLYGALGRLLFYLWGAPLTLDK